MTALKQDNSLQTVLDSIRITSNDNLTPTRVNQLEGMSQLCGHLAEVGVQVPPMLYGFIDADLERVRDHATKKTPKPLSDTDLILRFLTLMKGTPHFDALAGDDYAQVWLAQFARMPECTRFLLAFHIQMKKGRKRERETKDRETQIAEITDMLYKIDAAQLSVFSTIIHCIEKCGEDPVCWARFEQLEEELDSLPDRSRAVLRAIYNDHGRTFHILFGQPVPGEEAH